MSCCPWAGKCQQVFPLCPFLSASSVFPPGSWGNLPSAPSSRCWPCRARLGLLREQDLSSLSAAAALGDTKATGCLAGKAHLGASIHLPNVTNTGTCPHKTSVVLVPLLFKREPAPCQCRLWASAHINSNSLGSVCLCFFCFRIARSNAIGSFICDSCSS